MSHTCDDLTFLPSGKLIVRGLSAVRLLTTSMPSMTKIEVAPVSAMACVVAIVNALRYSLVGFPRTLRAVAAIDVGAKIGSIVGRGGHCDLQFDVGTVASSSSMMEKEKYLVGSKESMCAVTKLLNLFAISISAPNRQTCPGKIDLCMPLVHALHPASNFCCAFERVKYTSWHGLRQSKWHVIESCPSSTSKPHE